MMKHLFCYTLMLVCLVLAGCKNAAKQDGDKEPIEEPKKSVAKKSTWDYHLLGQWHYVETAEKQKNVSEYPEGIEVFHADGTYECYTQDSKDKKTLINGTWKLDDKENFVVWVTPSSVQSAASKSKKDDDGDDDDDEDEDEDDENEVEPVKYVIHSLAPQEMLTYQVGKAYRTATWVADQH